MTSEERSGNFDWVANAAQLAPLLTPEALRLPATASVVDIGCGNSWLPLHLATQLARVTALDREADCVASMQATHGAQHERVTWVACDVCDAEALASVCPQGSADLVFDKGTLDCAIVEQDAARLLYNVRTSLLAPEGVYVVVSFRKPDLLVPLLSLLDWEVVHAPLPLSDREQPASVCTMRRAANGAPPTFDALSLRTGELLDQWYREEAPLMTAERAQQLRTDWAAALAARRADSGRDAGAAEPAADGPLPLTVAWEVMLSADERSELPLDDFAADVAPFLAEPLVDAAASLDHARITLAAAMAYLVEQQ